MTVRYCSLGFKPLAGQEQSIPATGAYTTLQFPYGAQENDDPWDMHSPNQGSSFVAYPDPKAGLIYPAVAGLGCLELNIIWMDGNYTELRDVFVRDPFGTPDQTAYDHRARTPGENCFTKQHWLLVHPSTPLCVQVAHDGTTAAKVRMAQLKLTIFDVDAPESTVRRAVPGRTDPWPDMR